MQTIRLDNSDPPDNDIAAAVLDFTNQQLWIALTSKNCDFSQFRADGRDFLVVDSDGVTPLVTSLRVWKAGSVGMRFHSRFPVSGAASPDYGNYVHAYGIRSGNLGYSNPPHTVYGESTHAGRADGKQEGRLRCLDKNNTLLWTWIAPGNDSINHFEFADLDADGVIDTILAGTSRISRTVYALNLTNPPTTRWSFPFSTQGNTYIRACASGNLRQDLPGNEIAISGSEGIDSNSAGSARGKIVILDKDGNQLSSANQDPSVVNHTTQDCIMADLLNAGQLDIFAAQAQHIYKYNNVLGLQWNTTHDGNRNYYALAAGRLTSTTTRVIVATAGIAQSDAYIGIVTAIDNTGNILWDKPLPFHGYGIKCIDIDGDGYDEIIVATGTAAGGASGTNFGPPEQGWGIFFILDRFGNELFAFQGPSPAKDFDHSDFDGSGIKRLQGSGDEGRFMRWTLDSGVTSAVAKVIVPSVAWKEVRDLGFVSSGSISIAPKGDRYFDFSGADGSDPTNYTQQIGVWTMQGGKIASPDDGDAATAACLEVTGVSTEGFEWEFSAYKPGQGTGAGGSYYNGGRYRCTAWSGGRPDCYTFQHAQNGAVSLIRSASGSPTTVYSVFTGTTVASTFGITDKVSYRVVVMGNWHALYYRKNDTGGWLEMYNVQDTNAGKTSAAGSIAFLSQRGQTRISESYLWTFKNSDGNSGPGPVPLMYSTAIPPTPPGPNPPTSGKRLLNNGSARLLNGGGFRLLNGTAPATTGNRRLLNNGSFRLLNNGSFRLLNGVSNGVIPPASLVGYATYVHTGNTVDYIPDQDVDGGDVIDLGSFVGIALRKIPAGTLGALHVEGIFSVDKADGEAIVFGSTVFWNSADRVATTNIGYSGLIAGKCVRSALADDYKVRVKLLIGMG